MSDVVVIGEGRLSWSADERRTDRYGSVVLDDGRGWPQGCVRPDRGLAGRRGSLVAEVLETREAAHLGDFFRRFGAGGAQVGDRLVLGSGTVFIEPTWHEVEAIGVRPDDGRDSDWLKPDVLYQAQNQTVRLVFEPES